MSDQKMLLRDLVKDIDNHIDEALRVYLDSTMGYQHNKVYLEKSQKAASQETGKNIAELDKINFTYGTGDPGAADSKVWLEISQEQFKLHNSDRGKNEIFVGQMTLIFIFSFWEEIYRPKMARILNVQKNEISIDIFGELRNLRNDIVHHGGVATRNNTGKNRIISFTEGTEIRLGQDLAGEIASQLRRQLEGFVLEKTGYKINLTNRYSSTGHYRI